MSAQRSNSKAKSLCNSLTAPTPAANRTRPLKSLKAAMNRRPRGMAAAPVTPSVPGSSCLEEKLVTRSFRIITPWRFSATCTTVQVSRPAQKTIVGFLARKCFAKSQQEWRAPAVSLNAVRTKLRISWLLAACLFLPLLSNAQSREPSYGVSVRELSIPPKALQAFQKGVELLAKKDAAGSLPHFQRAVAEFASFYEAYYKMGVADLKLWRVADAEEAYRRSIELSGGQYAQPLLALGVLLSYREKFAEAERVTREGLDLDPTSWAGHYSLGCALFGLDRLEEAEKSVQEAL